MFRYFRDLLETLRTLNNNTQEIKMLLIMFIGANGLSNITDAPKLPTDEEIKKDGGFVLNPLLKPNTEKIQSSDFFGYQGEVTINQEEELLDASEL
jgi:hypothetical protein